MKRKKSSFYVPFAQDTQPQLITGSTCVVRSVLPPPPAQFICTDEVGVVVILQAYSGWVLGSILGSVFGHIVDRYQAQYSVDFLGIHWMGTRLDTRLSFLIYSRWVPGSILGWVTVCPDWGFSWVSLDYSGNCYIIYVITAFLKISTCSQFAAALIDAT
jgi:predicted branched-subunit amino acid permease